MKATWGFTFHYVNSSQPSEKMRVVKALITLQVLGSIDVVGGSGKSDSKRVVSAEEMHRALSILEEILRAGVSPVSLEAKLELQMELHAKRDEKAKKRWEKIRKQEEKERVEREKKEENEERIREGHHPQKLRTVIYRAVATEDGEKHLEFAQKHLQLNPLQRNLPSIGPPNAAAIGSTKTNNLSKEDEV